ncbi:hypothetical protein [Arthrobacter sp. efr-133-R2A-120]|uniref:hypothetical protein n=1 Tax=Arthrobacter sp. efr-133-R2A-120 TaxID=3040277 RepID=UPI00254E9CE9|nr:hypothetical protein [Arthrobacter sp. efr-133-R2A-120]
MGLRSFFIRGRTPVTEDSSPAAVAAPKEEREPLTPAQLADLRKAWAELNQAAEDAGVNTFRACTRDGSSWEDDPEAVRGMAALIRGLPRADEAASTDGDPAP